MITAYICGTCNRLQKTFTGVCENPNCKSLALVQNVVLTLMPPAWPANTVAPTGVYQLTPTPT